VVAQPNLVVAQDELAVVGDLELAAGDLELVVGDLELVVGDLELAVLGPEPAADLVPVVLVLELVGDLELATAWLVDFGQVLDHLHKNTKPTDDNERDEYNVPYIIFLT